MDFLLPVVSIAIFTYVLINALIPFSEKFGLVDIPCERKKHVGNIPLVGGIAIYISTVVFALLFVELDIQLMSIILIGGMLTTIGTLDDRFSLSVKSRLFIQLAAGLLISAGMGIQLTNFGDLIGIGPVGIGSGALSIVVTCLAVAGLANAFNMMDGIDGLAGAISITALAPLLFFVNGSSAIFVSLIITSIFVFLLFNLNVKPIAKTKIFMGDSGSMFLGFTIAALMILFTQGENKQFEPVTALWFVAIPMMDMVSTMVRRMRKGQSPFYPDRTHLHHLLMHFGFSAPKSLFIIILSSALLSTVGIYLNSINDTTSFVLFIIIFILYLQLILHAWKIKKAIN